MLVDLYSIDVIVAFCPIGGAIFHDSPLFYFEVKHHAPSVAIRKVRCGLFH